MKVIITADSTSDLPQNFIYEREIKIFPLSILLGENSYLDSVEIKPQNIYDYVSETGNMPKTAAVGMAQYYDFFKAASDAGNAVVHIGLSSAISASFQNALIAAQEFKNVYCVDSKSLCTAMGLLVLKACDLRDRGMDAKKIAARINSLVPKVSATFVLDSLEYLHRGGRCSSVAKFGANVLKIKPSIAVDPQTGKMDVAKKYRGKISSVYEQYVSDCLKDAAKADKSRIVIANSGNVPGETIAFAKGLIEGKNEFKEIITADAGCTISSHCGPGTLAIFYIVK
ncbi:MAG: DegV family protein [Clostridiales bacterium]|nr:DegV family protein [Clostridiales bacterium]